MKKLMDKIKKNNKGFTLVELIVVIAIIAIITVVVAPQYIQYVEKSKEATDKNAMGEIVHALEIAIVEASADGTVSVSGVTVGANGTVKISENSEPADAVQAAFNKIIPQGDDKYVFTSKRYKASTGTISVDSTTGAVTWTEPPAL